MNEVNVKEIELIEKTTGLITKRIKPNFKTLGPRYGKWMKQIAALVAEFSQERIAEVEAAPETVLDLGAERITVTPADFEITSEDMPGLARGLGRQADRGARHHRHRGAARRRRGTRVDKPHPEYPQGLRIRGHGQDPRQRSSRSPSWPTPSPDTPVTSLRRPSPWRSVRQRNRQAKRSSKPTWTTNRCASP